VTTFTISPGDDLYARLSDLAPGDEVVVHAGTYPTPGFFAVTWAGTADRPIVVRAADGERPIIQGTPAQNVINLDGSYFTMRGFEITGGSHGIRLGNADHGTLESLVIHDLGDVGISCNRPAMACSAMTIRGNEIYATGADGTGEGMYLGCNDAECAFSTSLVERNYVHDLGGSQGDGIEVKTGAFGVTVRDNVIVRSGFPAITMYGYAGTGARNLVERNFVWHTGDNGIQVVGQIIVRNNIILDAGANGIQSKASQNFSPHDVDILHNTIVGAGAACLKTNDWPGQANQLIAANALYCPGGTALDVNGGAPGATVTGNIGLGSANPASGLGAGQSVAADLGDPTHAAVYPPAGSALIDVGAPDSVTDDFNGLPRNDGHPDVGAYERSSAANPGWSPVEGFKTTALVADAGVAAGADGGAASPDGPVDHADARMTASIDAGAGAGTDARTQASGDAGTSQPSSADTGCAIASASPSALIPVLVVLVLAKRAGVGRHRRT
jgi:Right handed beta helix region